VSVLIAAERFLRHDYAAMLDEIAPGVARTAATVRRPELPALRAVAWLGTTGGVLDLAPLTSACSDASWADALAAQVSPADLATLFFTSGTTAEPKGVVHTQRAIRRAADDVATVLGLTAEDRTWGYLPFFFTGGLVAVALATLARGGAVVLQEVFDAGEALRLLEGERCTVFFAWPHQAQAITAHPDFRRDRLVLHKGVGANAKWADLLYPPDHQAVGTFGMTETAPLCTAWPWDAPLALRAGSHGPPVGEKEVRICAVEDGRVLPRGEEGEICVRGPTLFSHYYRHEPVECFDREGFFHTGDLGRLDERGALHFLGRIKDVIKSAGVNIAAAEVEATLVAHPAVAAAHVVGVPDAARGENVAAFVVLTTPIETEQLLAYCRAQLAAFKVPRHLWIRREPELPQKASGKVDKSVLKAEALRLIGSATSAGTP
jgi:fatty-acyl-CoA synthase